MSKGRGKYSEYIEDKLVVRAYDGNEYYCLCPFHEDRNPSFSINAETGLFICYACGEAGAFTKLTDRIGEPWEAKPRDIADVLGTYRKLKVPETEGVQVHPDAWLKQFMPTAYSDAYWHARHFSPGFIADWGLGFDHRMKCFTIALRDIRGELLGVIRRRDDKQPWDRDTKYLNPKGFKRGNNLFASWNIRSGKPLGITEGPVDALSIWNAGTQAVAVFGKSISDHQVEMVKRFGPSRLLIFTDDNAEGNQLAEDITDRFARFYPLARGRYDGSKDPNEVEPHKLKKIIADTHHRAEWKRPR